MRTRPIIALLTGSVNVVMRLLGQQNTAESGVSEEDITYMLREGTQSGAVEAGEARFIQRVFRFTDRPVRSVMTPRTEVVAASTSSCGKLSTTRKCRVPEPFGNVVASAFARTTSV